MNAIPQPPPLPALPSPQRGPIARFFIGVWDAMNFTRRLILNLLFFFILLIVLLAPKPVDAGVGKVAFAAVKSVVDQRCVACHAATPTQPGFAQAPKGVVLESAEQIGQHAAKIAETVASGYMPLGNLTGITEQERRLIATWHAQGAATR